MKKLLLILIGLAILGHVNSGPIINSFAFSSGGAPTGNAFTHVGSTNDTSNYTNVNTAAGSVGDLICVAIKWENTGDITGLTGSVNGAYTALTEYSYSNNDLHVRMFWVIATGTGADNLTATTSGTLGFGRTLTWRFSASGTISVDTSTGTTAASGNLASPSFSTATVNGLEIQIYGEYSSEATSLQKINGIAATALNPSPQDSNYCQGWYYLNTAQIVSGTGTCTLTGNSSPWATALVAFKAQ